MWLSYGQRGRCLPTTLLQDGLGLRSEPLWESQLTDAPTDICGIHVSELGLVGTTPGRVLRKAVCVCVGGEASVAQCCTMDLEYLQR